MSLLLSDHAVVAIQRVGSRSWVAHSVQVSIEKADLETSSIRAIYLSKLVCLGYTNVSDGTGAVDVAQEIFSRFGTG